jgi:hypothetical protein
VKALAGKDALFYVMDRFDEPKAMRFPLWDADCAKCHARFDLPERRERGETGTPPFHSLPVHNSNLGISCVECHTAHATDVDPQAHFLNGDHLRTECARCHSEFAAP